MMLRLLTLLALILCPSLSWAAIAYVSTTDSTATNSQSSISTSVIVPSGTDRFMDVAVQTRSSTANSPVTGVTFNTSEVCTLGKTDVYTDTASFWYRSDHWYCIAPTVTTANVVVTWANTSNNQLQTYSVVLLTGVVQTSPVNATSSASGSGTTGSTTITSAADNSWIIDSIFHGDATSLTVGAGQTQRAARLFNGDRVGVSTMGPKTPAGSEVMDWTTGATNDFVTTAIAVTPSGGSDPATSAPTLANLTWTNGTDGVGVVSADILRCSGASCVPNIVVRNIPATNGSAGAYQDTGLGSNTTYGYRVRNNDAAGNPSATNTNGTVYITTGATFRVVLYSEDFNRVDATTLGANWTGGAYVQQPGSVAAEGFKIVSQRALSKSTLTDSYSTYNTAPPDNQWIQCKLSIYDPATGYPGLVLRSADSPTQSAYIFRIVAPGTTTRIDKVTAGTQVTLGTLSTSVWAQDDEMRAEAEGQALRFYRKRAGVETLMLPAVTDSTFTTGKAGLITYANPLTAGQLDDCLIGSITATPPVEPTISTLSLDATGATLSYGATTPTSIRVVTFSPTAVISSLTYPIASFPAGRFTQSWSNGLNGACFHPLNSAGVENTASSAYACGSLSTIVSAIDTAAPVVSACTPTGNLPFGTTSVIVSCTIDKPAVGAYDTTDITYASMANAMVTQSLQISATVSGLSAGTVTRYVRAQSTDFLGEVHPTTTSQAVTITVLAAPAADTTAPSTVTGLTVAVNGTVATLLWAAATDNVLVSKYQVYQSTDACVTPVAAGNPVTTTMTQVNLAPAIAYCWTVKAIDSSNNLSAAMSNQATATTGAVPDAVPPSDMIGLQVSCQFTAACVLNWTTGTDDRGAVTTTIERCQVVSGSACTNFGTPISKIAFTTQSIGLSAGTSWCFRGQHFDQAGNHGAYSATVCGTTLMAGLTQGRIPLTFGVQRLPRTP